MRKLARQRVMQRAETLQALILLHHYRDPLKPRDFHELFDAIGGGWTMEAFRVNWERLVVGRDLKFDSSDNSRSRIVPPTYITAEGVNRIRCTLAEDGLISPGAAPMGIRHKWLNKSRSRETYVDQERLIVAVRGVEVDVTEAQLRIARELISARGRWVGGKLLKASQGSRVDLIIGRLNRELRRTVAHIESHKVNGYRWLEKPTRARSAR